MSDNLNTLIDQYATIKNEIGRLENKKKELEICLSDLKAGAYESEEWRLTISDSVRENPDRELSAAEKTIADDAVAAYRATLTRQYLTAHTVEKTVRTHRIGLRNGKNLAA